MSDLPVDGSDKAISKAKERTSPTVPQYDVKFVRYTIVTALNFSGISLGLGRKASLSLRPASNRISWFSDGRPLGPPNFRSNQNTTHASFSDGTEIGYVEHFMAALALHSITDVDIDIHGSPEAPLLDGSAGEFFDSIEPSPLPDSYILNRKQIRRPIFVRDATGDSWAVALPSASYSVRVLTELSYPLGCDDISSEMLSAHKLAQARTFIRDPVDMVSVDEASVRLQGLKAALEQNAILLWSTKCVVSDLRYLGEWHCHKLLDMIGDLYCTTNPFTAEIIAFRPGHHLSHLLRSEINDAIREQVK